MEYAIYLHTNGELIHKNKIVYESDSSYFDSPFVRKVWYINPQMWTVKEYITFLEEAKKLGANQKSLQEYLNNWSLNYKL